jgi:hypothetical protein
LSEPIGKRKCYGLTQHAHLPTDPHRLEVYSAVPPAAHSEPRARTVFETFAFTAAIVPAQGARGSVAIDAPLRAPPPPLRNRWA